MHLPSTTMPTLINIKLCLLPSPWSIVPKIPIIRKLHIIMLPCTKSEPVYQSPSDNSKPTLWPYLLIMTTPKCWNPLTKWSRPLLPIHPSHRVKCGRLPVFDVVRLDTMLIDAVSEIIIPPHHVQDFPAQDHLCLLLQTTSTVTSPY